MARTPDETLETLGKRKKLSKAELEYMEVIWEHPNGISSEEIYACFSQARGTKSTLLHRISEKGYVEAVRQGKNYLYRPIVNRLEYQQAVLNQEMKKSMGIQSFQYLVAAFCGKKKLTEEQAERVEKFLKELEDE